MPQYVTNFTFAHFWYEFMFVHTIEVDDETKESTRKTEEKLDGRNKEGYERKKPK